MEQHTPSTPTPEAEAPWTQPEYIHGQPWELDFSTFPEGELDAKQWHFEEGTEVAGYNSEEQAYTSRPQNVRVEDGRLIIQAHHEQHEGREFTSARIDTRNSFAFDYGTLEVTAKLPRGVGTWPAAWLMPSNPQYDPREYGIEAGHPWEFSMNGEIDFMEAIGVIENENLPAAHSINQLEAGTLYTPGIIDDAYGKFHTYGVKKSPGLIEFTIDGEVFATREQTSDDPRWWPYEQDYYLILNLAMGGPWAGSEKAAYPPHGIDTSTEEQWKYEIAKISYEPLSN